MRQLQFIGLIKVVINKDLNCESIVIFMGIRFHRIKTAEVSSYDFIQDYTEDKSAALIGSSSDPRNIILWKFGLSNTSPIYLNPKIRVTFSHKFLEIRSYQKGLIVYGSNEEGSIVKYTVNQNNKQQIQYYSSPSIIKQIVSHPTENQLAVFSKDEFYLLESNTSLPLLVPNQTVRDTQMLFLNLDEGNTLFVATLETNSDLQTFFRIRKVREVEYGQTYTNETITEIEMQAWNDFSSGSIEKLKYFQKNSLLCFQLANIVDKFDFENDENITDVYNIFFTTDLQRLTLQPDLKNSEAFIFSETEDKIIFSKLSMPNNQSQLRPHACISDYSLGNEFILKNKQCKVEQLNRTIQGLIEIEGEKYPLFLRGYNIKVYDWDLTSSPIQYSDTYAKQFLPISDGLLEKASSGGLDQIHEYNIVPISSGGIVGIVLGSVFVFVVLLLLVIFSIIKRQKSQS